MASGSKLDGLALIRQMAKNDLIHLLESVPGTKDLIIDECLMKPLDRFVGAALLRKHGVDKIFKFADVQGGAAASSRHRVYLVRPSMIAAKVIADSIKSQQEEKAVVIFVPKKMQTCEMVFEQNGVFENVQIEEFNHDLIWLNNDLFSLELPEYFVSTYLHSTLEWVHSAARSLWHIQSLFGPIPRIYGIGQSAEHVIKLTDTFFWEFGEPRVLTSESPINHAFLVDRDLDFATVFLSSLNYEALLDETFGIQCGFVEFPSEVTKQEKSAKVLLSDQDEVFQGIKNRHFSTVFAHLGNRAKELQVVFDKRNHLNSVTDLKQFVSQELKDLKTQHRSLAMHIGACEVILNKKTNVGFEEQLHVEHNMINGAEYRQNIAYIEDWMCQQQPEHVALSLICLLSVTSDGLAAKDYQSLRTQFCHAYGFKHLYTWHNLKRLGVLRERANVPSAVPSLPGSGNISQQLNRLKSSQFQTMYKRMSLFAASENLNLKNPSDMSYVFNGAYIPAICQMVVQSLQMGFSKDEISRNFSCPVTVKTSSGASGGGGTSGIILVYFLGGVTWAEIACLRLIGELRGYKFMIAATHIINRQKLLQHIAEA